MTDATDLNAAWDLFCKTNNCEIRLEEEKKKDKMPTCSDLYISTKTIICYLNTEIDINLLFWNIPIIPYYNATDGVLKKEIKITTNEKTDLDDILKNIEHLDNVKMNIITNINSNFILSDLIRILIMADLNPILIMANLKCSMLVR